MLGVLGRNASDSGLALPWLIPGMLMWGAVPKLLNWRDMRSVSNLTPTSGKERIELGYLGWPRERCGWRPNGQYCVLMRYQTTPRVFNTIKF